MLTDAERWELRYRDERVTHAQLMLGVCEGERAQAQQRIAAAHGVDVTRPYRFLPDGRVEQIREGAEVPRGDY